MCAMDEWTVADLGALVRRAANFAELSGDVLLAVLDLLSGGTPQTSSRSSRPRIVSGPAGEHAAGSRGRGAGRHRQCQHDPDRGLFGVFTADGRRVGELDEEMVYEAGAASLPPRRLGVADPGHHGDRVLVEAAPGEPGKMPFWKGDKQGDRSSSVAAIGEVTREVAALPERRATALLRKEFGLDELAAANLVRYLEDERDAAGALPDDRTIVVERFRDELGDWRVCLLSPFGARMRHAVGDGDRGPPDRAPGRRRRGALERRRHRDPAARERIASRWRTSASSRIASRR